MNLINDRNLVRGLFLIAIAATFGITAWLHYPIGDFARAGPGLFPLIMSAMLLMVGIATVVRSRFTKRLPIDFNFKNIALVLGSLCGLAILSEYVNMIAGIIFMVFVATLAGTSYSPMRNVKICAGLIAIAFAFQKFLGVNLPLLGN